eukprot:jgi/Mesen1/1780/ME000014S01195
MLVLALQNKTPVFTFASNQLSCSRLRLRDRVALPGPTWASFRFVPERTQCRVQHPLYIFDIHSSGLCAFGTLVNKHWATLSRPDSSFHISALATEAEGREREPRSGMSKSKIILLGAVPPRTVKSLSEVSEVIEFKDHPDREGLLQAEGHAIKVVATTSFVGFDSALFDKLPALEIISCFGVGTDSIDVEAAAARGVKVTNTPDVLTDDVADLTLALILAVSRRICEADRYVRAGEWPKKGMMPLTRKVSGKTVGILGLGRIGLAIAKRAEAFDCKIAYFSRSQKKDVPYTYHGSPVELARNCDFLVAACPLSKDTRHIVSREVLDALGPQGTLINIARGPVVDEAELVKALAEGRVGGAGLDVFEEEPKTPEALWKMDNVVLLPHVGSATEETRGDMGELMVANLRAYFGGEPLITPVN